MNNNKHIEPGQISKRLLAMTLDILSLVITSLILFFAVLYGIAAPCSNYHQNNAYVEEININERLNLETNNPDYKFYEKELLDFYFVRHKDEMVEHFFEYRGEKRTIEHVYNVEVLGLPNKPSIEHSSNEYFEYQQDPDTGKIDVNKVGVLIKPDPGTEFSKRYYRDLRDIFLNEYKELPLYVKEFNVKYADAIYDNIKIDLTVRSSVIGFSLIVFYIIIPLCNKHGSTLFERIYHLGHVNSKTGYKLFKYKIILRPFILYSISAVMIMFSSEAMIAFAALAPILLHYLLLIFTSANKDTADWILSMETVNLDTSDIFESKKDETKFMNSDEYKRIDDPDFLSRLESVETFNLSESRSDEINKDNSKETKK